MHLKSDPGSVWSKAGKLRFNQSPCKVSLKEKEDNEKWPKGKSIWSGRNGEAVNVETFALQYDEDMGFKGVHCETRVIHMLFGLLFWDIIFAPVPGAFETPFQSAPLDIAEDSFYHSRKEIIEQRLEELESGKAQDIIGRTDDEYRPNGTYCVGVRWDLFTKQDLIEIVTVRVLKILRVEVLLSD
ncbi:hypothetical protein SERLADRAFT_441630 [Serpula lacrymans var. lacrymans S7.9]|uniref:Fanconi-associated nuclease n=2 Tax=Serpula lacrymans var. lacrymans TaxID=341189 RepID=F8P755_SERL9|nr:uncharacterized protein SERLADRAFT_441630 [Serpula lacrymans var. lacrymans S7.9]EGO21271.1 hypothetical protein SERLADRAFT_441630 [Serpula lacrymans var. lacrymans S7.9]